MYEIVAAGYATIVISTAADVLEQGLARSFQRDVLDGFVRICESSGDKWQGEGG